MLQKIAIYFTEKGLEIVLILILIFAFIDEKFISRIKDSKIRFPFYFAILGYFIMLFIGFINHIKSFANS